MYMLQQNGEVTRTKMMNIFLTEDMSYGNERTKKKTTQDSKEQDNDCSNATGRVGSTNQQGKKSS